MTNTFICLSQLNFDIVHFLFLTYFNGSNATLTSCFFSLTTVDCLNNRIFLCISESSFVKSRGNLTRILGVGYFIRTVDPSGLTKVVGYRRENKVRFTLVTTARLELKFRFCSKQLLDKLKKTPMIDSVFRRPF